MLRNRPSQTLGFFLVSPTTGQPVTGAAVTALAQLDAATPVSCTWVESGNGHYRWTPTQAQTDAGQLTFSAMATGTVAVDKTVHPRWASELYPEGVYINSGTGTPGTTVGSNGTRDRPVTTMADAAAILGAIGDNRVKVFGSLSLASGASGYHFSGAGDTTDLVDFNSQNVADSEFHDISLIGTGTGEIRAYNCVILAATSIAFTMAADCLITDALTLTGASAMTRCYWTPDATLSLPSGGCELVDQHGFLNIGTVTLGSHNVEHYGRLSIGAGVTGGTLTFVGMGQYADSSAGATIDRSGWGEVKGGFLVVDEAGIATSHLDLANGVETGLTVRQAHRLMMATNVMSKRSGGPAGPWVHRDINDTKNRVTTTTDANGDITAVTVDAT